MTVLCIFLSGDGVCNWRLQPSPNDAQRLPAAGESGERTPYGELPRAARVEAIVPAARMRTLNVMVPPTPAPKLAAVVRFALEDQLAGDVDAQHIVIAAQREREAIVHIIDRRWLTDTLAQLARAGMRPARIAAESDLAPRAPLALATWIWRDDGGFLLEPSGRVSVLDQSDDALPSGLLLVLRAGGARERADVPPRIVVRGPDQLSARGGAWSRAAGIDFVLEPEWSWLDSPPATVAAAPNLLTPDLEPGQLALRAASRPRLLRVVAGWLVAALVLHAGASAADWAMLTWRSAQVERETLQLIRDGAPALTGDPYPAWRKHYAGARHRAGKAAPDDALPLLAEAAAGLSNLPPAALRVISFEAGQLTLDFDRS
ncbi:MAG: type II secretion system protein GspL, partial [Betaproteobacteria bacterium]